MQSENEVRERVSEAYARAVESGGGCCGDTATSQCAPAPKGVAAKVAGYSRDELESLPQESVVNSFGCGNPLAFADVAEGDVVLDLGSGAGIDVLLAASRVGPTGRVIGVDMTDEMLERAQSAISESGRTNVEVRKGIIEELPVESGSVDLVISNCVINLSPDKARVFKEIARVLKPGGRMQVSDIVVENLPRWMRASRRLYYSCVAGAISESAYVGGLRAAGLEEVEVTERLVYDASQLAALALSEGPESLRSLPGGGKLAAWFVRRLARSLEGKIWSAKFTARRSATVAPLVKAS